MRAATVAARADGDGVDAERKRDVGVGEARSGREVFVV